MRGDEPIEKLLGRVLMVAPPDGWLEGPLDWLDELQPAGVILFKRNLPKTLAAASAGIARLEGWAAARGETLLVAMDEEGGFVTQTDVYMPVPPSARALAWAAGPEATHRAFAAYGRRLRHLGVNLDFAPVCDVNDNPRNPVIGVRSFGTEAGLVTRYALAVHEGLAEAGLLSCAKHFPGHGDTDLDSHLTLPVLHHGRERMEAVELVPFRALLSQVPVIMVAHLACPKLVRDLGAPAEGELPATLAHSIATDLLRRELGFTGVAVTDAMDMKGVAGVFGEEEAAVRALLAGCDLLLYCFEIDKPQRARAGLRAALESGRIPRTRLEEAAARVDVLRERAATSPRSTTLPPEEEDAATYHALCRAALRFENAPAWDALARAAKESRRVQLVGWQEQLLGRLAARLRGRGFEVGIAAPKAGLPHDAAPCLAVFGERRPLPETLIASLRDLARSHPGAGLANLLTPEVDAQVAPDFTAVVRTADASDAMLDALLDRWLGSGV